jgi:hypothetical protein
MRDDRETGVGLQTQPSENGDWDQPAVDDGQERLDSVLGW